MNDVRCELTDLLPDQCSHCRARTGGVDEVRWTAHFETICRHPSCLQVIEVGEAVKWSPDGGMTVHARHSP